MRGPEQGGTGRVADQELARIGQRSRASREVARLTLHFKASIPRSWRNDGESPARFIATGTLPKKFRAMMHGRVAEAAPGPKRVSR